MSDQHLVLGHSKAQVTNDSELIVMPEDLTHIVARMFACGNLAHDCLVRYRDCWTDLEVISCDVSVTIDRRQILAVYRRRRDLISSGIGQDEASDSDREYFHEITTDFKCLVDGLEMSSCERIVIAGTQSAYGFLLVFLEASMELIVGVIPSREFVAFMLDRGLR